MLSLSGTGIPMGQVETFKESWGPTPRLGTCVIHELLLPTLSICRTNGLCPSSRGSQASPLPRGLMPSPSAGRCPHKGITTCVSGCTRCLGLGWLQGLPAQSHLPNAWWHCQPRVERAITMPIPPDMERDARPTLTLPHLCPGLCCWWSWQWSLEGVMEKGSWAWCQNAGKWMAEKPSQEVEGGGRCGTHEPRP